MRVVQLERVFSGHDATCGDGPVEDLLESRETVCKHRVEPLFFGT